MGIKRIRWLSDLDPRHFLHLTCRGCGHRSVLSVSDVSAFLATRGVGTIHWDHLPRRFVCEYCGRRSPRVVPSATERG